MAAQKWKQAPAIEIDPSKRYSATITTSDGPITIDLLTDDAPNTVNNFVFLARQGFYDGIIFHRVINNFMIQTGDPTGTGSGGPGYKFQDEPVKRSYTRGIVAMANSGPNTNGSQFFIVHGADVGLPPSYTIFGEVTAGAAAVDAIATAPTQRGGGEQSKPVNPARIESVDVQES
ncbi:MAG: peptidylprolyl isomerase [Chloroflexota bacterium]|nr:MAG: peptidylprolyl isomerase [Chloroflexota bacterium]